MVREIQQDLAARAVWPANVAPPIAAILAVFATLFGAIVATAFGNAIGDTDEEQGSIPKRNRQRLTALSKRLADQFDRQGA